MKTITYNPETHVLVSRDLIDDAKQIFCSDVEPNTNGDCIDVIEWFSATLEAAAPQPEPVDSEPVASGWFEGNDLKALCFNDMPTFKPKFCPDAIKKPLYTTPQPDRTAELEEAIQWQARRNSDLTAERDAALAAEKVANGLFLDALKRCKHIETTIEPYLIERDQMAGEITPLKAALKVARDALNTCTHEGFCDYDDAAEALAKINEVLNHA